jgi:hypothetical protein
MKINVKGKNGILMSAEFTAQPNIAMVKEAFRKRGFHDEKRVIKFLRNKNKNIVFALIDKKLSVVAAKISGKWHFINRTMALKIKKALQIARAVWQADKDKNKIPETVVMRILGEAEKKKAKIFEGTRLKFGIPQRPEKDSTTKEKWEKATAKKTKT